MPTEYEDQPPHRDQLQPPSKLPAAAHEAFAHARTVLDRARTDPILNFGLEGQHRRTEPPAPASSEDLGYQPVRARQVEAGRSIWADDRQEWVVVDNVEVDMEHGVALMRLAGEDNPRRLVVEEEVFVANG